MFSFVDIAPIYSCSHLRAVYYFIESIGNNCHFTSHPCGRLQTLAMYRMWKWLWDKAITCHNMRVEPTTCAQNGIIHIAPVIIIVFLMKYFSNVAWSVLLIILLLFYKQKPQKCTHIGKLKPTIHEMDNPTNKNVFKNIYKKITRMFPIVIFNLLCSVIGFPVVNQNCQFHVVTTPKMTGISRCKLEQSVPRGHNT